MIAAASLAFPGSKTLALWWSQLAHFKPIQMWIGHLFIHRLEVLAHVVRAESVDPLQLMLLRALALEEGHEKSSVLVAEASLASSRALLERLDRRLHLSPDVIGLLLDDLRGLELLSPAPRAALTDSGRLALAKGQYPKRIWQRRELVFAERLRPDGTRLLPPHFLDLAGGAGQRWQPDAGAGFDLALLRDAVLQSQAWKDEFAFPHDIISIADPADERPEPPPWQRVAVDRPERLLVAIVALGAEAGDRIVVFAARQDGWELRGDKPIGSFVWSGRKEFPDLAESPGWSKAWQDWCQARQIPPAESQAGTLTQSAHRLNALVPAPLHARLVASKSDLLKGDTWLLAGEGYLRAAANVGVQAAG